MSTKASEEQRQKEIPDVVINPNTRKRYNKGRYLGKGGFAKCYELADADTKEVFAGKVVSKSLLTKQHQKDKMTQEIAIHRSLNHKHIVKFYGFFEDSENVYILLELCRRRSLMEMHKRRRCITEPETRYLMQQVVLGCKNLHDNRVIHRDLKLGNLFLTDEMDIKIGDFGLATRVDYDGERKKTLCGTPNYIAPEVLHKKGHSFEVDVWSLGCIIFTMLVGKPPFETSNLKDTYSRIKKNEYHIPSRVSPLARTLIQRLLQSDPLKRPTMEQILNDDFITTGYMPLRLPVSCLTTAPRFDTKGDLSASLIARKPLVDINAKVISVPNGISKDQVAGFAQLATVPEGAVIPSDAAAPVEDIKDEPADFYLSDLRAQLSSVLASKPSEKVPIQIDDAEDPTAIPMLWVSKWVDYSDKYGLGYQLCDNSVGVVFNDTTKLTLLADGDNIHYIERDGSEHYHTLHNFPDGLNKKVTLLKYFRNYMNEHLLKAGASITPREGDELSRIPYVRCWFRTRNGIVLHLTNGTLQINFFQDHTKIILCPLMGAVTYIDRDRDFRTFRFKLIETHGCSRDLACRLRYARTMVERLTSSKSGSGKNNPTT